jgi:4-hydroxybenzoate polyprenyltransferase
LNNGQFFILKKVAFLKTILLAFTWAFSTVIIPASNEIDINSEMVISIFLIRFVFMLMIGIIFDYRDIEKDQKTNLSSLVAAFNKSQLIGLMLGLLILNSAIIWLMPFQVIDIHKFILMLSTALCFLMFILSLKKRSYYFYYFLVDGIMLFSAIASLITTL